MLKIKDKIDLKELEKFGFTKSANDYIFGDKCEECLYVESDRNIGIYFLSQYADGDVSDEILETLFNLIQSGLIEKVQQ